MRLDIYLTDSGITKSRSQAAECIKLGLVSVNGRTDVKPSLCVTSDDCIALLGKPHSFVGRGGVKLDYALSFFEINVTGMRAVDIGASTGGFTDCLLQRGASSVLAVDSGHGQLDEKLLSDDRVTSFEGFNARNMSPDTVPAPFDIAVTDVSFISQSLIIPPAFSVLSDGGIYIGLIKPQFECGPKALGKNGVIKDKKHYKTAIDNVISSAVREGFAPMGITRSPICGGDGNTEFLIYMQKNTAGISLNDFEKTINEVCS